MALSKGERTAIINRLLREVRALPVRNVPSLRAIRKSLSTDMEDESAADVVAIAHGLLEHKLRWMGYELIYNHIPARRSLRIDEVEALGAGMAHWSHVDTFGLSISGPAWMDRQIGDADVKRWARSNDFWWRRAALVSTVILNSRSRGGGYIGGDAKRTLSIASLLIDDREDMVVKGLSWALRVLAVVDPPPVRRFLEEHDERLAARVKRETRTKLETGRKNKPTGA